MLTQTQIRAYELRLQEERGKLIGQLEKKERPVDFGSDVDDVDSTEADEAEQFANELSVAQTLRDRLEEIDAALAAVTDGTYGTCTKCGKGISTTVLNIAPESRLCEQCKRGA